MNLKKYLLLLPILFTVQSISAQQLELQPFVGYTFQNKFDISGGRAKLSDGLTYGLTASVAVGDNNALEFLYSRQESRLYASSIFFTEDYIRDVSINYIMVGGNKVFPSVDSPLQYFGGMKVGMAILDSPSADFNTLTKFAAGLNLGFKYFMTDAIGIRGGFNLNFPITDVGAGIGWSSSGGTSVGVSGWSPIVQFAFTGGLTLRLVN